MSSASLRLAVVVVRAWTRLYTWRMPPDPCDARRAEIESDLWEFQEEAAATGGLGPAAHVLARCLAGVPDDLRWRVEQPSLRDRRFSKTVALTTVGLFLAALWAFIEVQPGAPPHAPAPPSLKLLERLPPPPPPPPPPPRRNPTSTSAYDR